MPPTLSITSFLLATALACALTTSDAGAATHLSRSEALASHDRKALWQIVKDVCVPDMRLRGKPAPCASVDLRRGFVVLDNIAGRRQILLIPTSRLTGIEDPQLLSPTAPNYWQAAWEARAILAQRLGHQVAREAVGLAVNSVLARTQDQLHIHVDCLRSDVAAELRVRGDAIGAHWSDLPIPLAGQRYRAMRVMGYELGSRDPFKLLAADPIAHADMGEQTLVVAGYRTRHGKPGFLLLSDRADPSTGDRAHGEDLLDHGCPALQSAPPAQAPKKKQIARVSHEEANLAALQTSAK
jgi:CDP-diacylglycerol pyrophosphatase